MNSIHMSCACHNICILATALLSAENSNFTGHCSWILKNAFVQCNIAIHPQLPISANRILGEAHVQTGATEFRSSGLGDQRT